jgi:hypothetical protein
MNTSRLRHTVDRRRFLGTAIAALGASGLALRRRDLSQGVEDEPNTHNMLVVGSRTAFLSHLPMFEGLDGTKTAFVSPHRFQVILEATFSRQGQDRTGVYFKDRQANPTTRIYTLNPEQFVLSRAFTPSQRPSLTTFAGTVVRGHFEQGGTAIPDLKNATVTVTRVVHGRMFDPRAAKPAALEYILFGKGPELFLAHAVFAPPDFDQVLSVSFPGGGAPNEKELAGDLRVVVPSRKNVVAERLRENQKFDALLHVGAAEPRKVQIETGVQFYFEEGELLVPHTFQPTAEEKKK